MLRALPTSNNGAHRAGELATLARFAPILLIVAALGSAWGAHGESPTPTAPAFRAYTLSDNIAEPIAVTRLPSGATIVALEASTPALTKLLPDGTVAWSFRLDNDYERPWLTSVGETPYLAASKVLDRASVGERTEIRILALDEDGAPRIVRTITMPNIAYLDGFGSNRDSTLWLGVSRAESATLLVLDRNAKPLRQLSFRTPKPISIEKFTALDDGSFAVAGTDGASCMAGVFSATGSIEWLKSLGGAKGSCLEVAASGDRIALLGTVANPPGWRFLLLSRAGELIADRAVSPAAPTVGFVVAGDDGSFLAAGRTPSTNRLQLASVNRSGVIEGQWSLPEPMGSLNSILASESSGGKRSLVYKLDQARWALFELDSGKIAAVPRQFEPTDTRWGPVQTVAAPIALTAFDEVFSSQLIARPAFSALSVSEAREIAPRAPPPFTASASSPEPLMPLGPLEPADTVLDDEHQVRAEFAGLFRNHEWKTLDARLDRAIAKRERTATTNWVLWDAHEALTFSSAELAGVSEEAYFAAIDEWCATAPASHHPRLLRAQSWHAIAWSHRGPGFAATVTDEGFKLWDQYEKLALKELRTLDASKPASPEFYAVYVDVLGANSLDASDVLVRGMRVAPQYHYLYQFWLSYLRPQWGGSPEDVTRFLKLVHSTLAPEELELVWARVLFDTLRFTRVNLTPAEVDKPLTLRSLQRIRDTFPASRQAAYRRAALTCSLHWKEPARAAFSDPVMKYHSELSSNYFGGGIRYANCRTWALSTDPAPPSKSGGWRAALFENEVAFADGRRADGFRSFLARDGEQLVAVTAIAPLLDPAQGKGANRLGEFSSWMMRPGTTGAKPLAVMGAKTGASGLLSSDAVLLNVKDAQSQSATALVPSEVTVELWSPVWIVARDGDEPVTTNFGLVLGGGDDKFNVETVHLSAGPQLSGSPVVDSAGRLLGTVIGMRGDGRVECERFGSTRARSAPPKLSSSTSSGIPPEMLARFNKPYNTRTGTSEPFPAEWTAAAKQPVLAGNMGAFEDIISKFADAFKPGYRVARIVVGGSLVRTQRFHDPQMPFEAYKKVDSIFWDLTFPENTNGAYDVAIGPDRHAAIVPPLDAGP